MCKQTTVGAPSGPLALVADPTGFGLWGSDEALACLSFYLADLPHAQINSHSRVIPAPDLLQSCVDWADMVYLASCFLCRRCLSPYVRHFLPPSCTGQQNIKWVGRMQKCHPEREYAFNLHTWRYSRNFDLDSEEWESQGFSLISLCSLFKFHLNQSKNPAAGLKAITQQLLLLGPNNT